MRERCRNPGHVRYHRYGGRGIKVCERWSKFALFVEDMEPSWQEGLTLERLDSDADYGPANCVWESPYGQAKNTIRIHVIDTPRGPMILGDAAEVSGIHRTTLFSRVKAGWPASEMFRDPQ